LRRDRARRLFSGLLVVAVAFPVVTYVLSIPLGVTLFFLTPEGARFSESAAKGLPVELFVWANFIVPLKLSHGSIFAAAVAVYGICFIAAWVIGIRFHKVILYALQGSFSNCAENVLFALPVFSSMLLVVILAIQKVQETSGVPTGALNFPNEFSAFLALSYSPISEEIGFRLTPIGIFLILYLSKRFNQLHGRASLPSWIRFAAISLLLPDRAKARVDLPTFSSHGLRAVTKVELALVGFTSVAFAFAHYASGAGWGVGKISGTFLAGMALGLSYLLYGAHASILLHWFFNYYFTAYNLASHVYAGPFVLIAAAVESWMVGLGMVGWASFAAWLFQSGSLRSVGFPLGPRG